MANNERLYFDTLKRITRYQSPERLRRYCEREYGLAYEEALEAAYENVLMEAKLATAKRRRPTP